ncbi:hypothetical protein [Allomesorhizobium camelthorni]|uniref:Uncharacterized protein n=1 Tax=Allomesorhizobium camelthorni TaxID=475069 RepID=A0A6G4WK93_9HYPH|nr:hypothetical protein [Mesorhizobium camelthorni]NGO54778.1 hypothetical protein [Mesorhizobium camelthorni]
MPRCAHYRAMPFFWLDFYWSAVHALEKYLKAVLLMNGLSAKAPAGGFISIG